MSNENLFIDYLKSGLDLDMFSQEVENQGKISWAACYDAIRFFEKQAKTATYHTLKTFDPSKSKMPDQTIAVIKTMYGMSRRDFSSLTGIDKMRLQRILSGQYAIRPEEVTAIERATKMKFIREHKEDMVQEPQDITVRVEFGVTPTKTVAEETIVYKTKEELEIASYEDKMRRELYDNYMSYSIGIKEFCEVFEVTEKDMKAIIERFTLDII